MILQSVEFWRHHLSAVDEPMLHYLSNDLLDLDVLRTVGAQLQFPIFVIDTAPLRDASNVLDVFDRVVAFPSYFSRNWDALLDVMTDLSWVPARGYVLVLKEGNPFETLRKRDARALLGVIEETVRDWRDTRGEWDERPGLVAFHVLLAGPVSLRKYLLDHLMEPLCEHSPTCISVTSLLGGVGPGRHIAAARQLVEDGAPLEQVLLFLRRRRFDIVQSSYVLANLLRKTRAEAKTLVEGSETWYDFSPAARAQALRGAFGVGRHRKHKGRGK